MKKFKYRALKSDGNKFEGNYEAGSEEEVIRMISSGGAYPLKIEEITNNKLYNYVKNNLEEGKIFLINNNKY